MLRLLFDISVLYDILTIIGIILIVFACIKYPSAKWFVSVFLAIVLIVSTCYCAIQLNYYYSASGGIYGKITGIFNTNVVEVEELNFSLTNVELVKEYENTYSAKVLNNNVIKLNKNDNFIVYVNNEPCSISQIETEEDYCIANYSYIFYGEDKSVLCEDTLTFRFAFYTNSTYLSVSTNGGATAVKYWNYYFNKNVFDIRIERVDLKNNEQISIGTGNTNSFNEYCFVKFVAIPGLNYYSEDGNRLTSKSEKTIEVQIVKKNKYAIMPVFDMKDYFYDTCYEYSSSISTFSDEVVPSVSQPPNDLICRKLVSFIFAVGNDDIGFEQIYLNSHKFSENTIVFVFPVYENA